MSNLEKRIIELIKQGKCSIEICQKLNISGLDLQNILLTPQIIFKTRKPLHPEFLDSCLLQVVERLPCGSINVLGIYQVLHNYLSYLNRASSFRVGFYPLHLNPYFLFVICSLLLKLTHSKMKRTYKSPIFSYLICNSQLKRIHRRIKFTYKFAFFL